MDNSPLSGMRALSLVERKVAVRPLPGLDDPSLGEAAKMAQWWERTYFPGQRALFSRRLRADGLNRRTVVPFLLAGSRRTPAPFPGSSRGGPLPGTGWGSTQGCRDFEPFVRSAWRLVDEAIATLEDAGPTLSVERAAIRHDFSEYLGQRLFDIGRGFSSCASTSRSGRGGSGAHADERFESWARAELGDGAALGKLLHDFPVLDRSLSVAATAAASAWAEMLVRLAADAPAIRAVTGRADTPDRLVGVEASLGDTHNGGRTVICASGWHRYWNCSTSRARWRSTPTCRP